MRVRLQGGRFEEAGLPFPILVDLEQLQSMVVEIAKWRFRENRGRIRSPSGFDQAYLKISGLRGSSVVEVDLGTTLPVLEGESIPNQEYFEDAGSLLVEAIESAGRGAEHPNASLPARYMGYFNRIGRSLLNDEVMEIEVAGGRAARLTQKLRAVLVHRSVNDLMRDVTVRGTVTEADQKNMTFRLQQIHGAQVDCSFHERHGDTVIEAHASYKSHKGRNRILVRVQGTGTYGKFDRLQRVDPCHECGAAGSAGCRCQTGRVSQPAGWLARGRRGGSRSCRAGLAVGCLWEVLPCRYAAASHVPNG